MTQRIIVGYGDTEGGRDALALAVALADLDPTSELTVARIYMYNAPHEPSKDTGWRKALRDAAEQELEPARARFGARERTSFTGASGMSPADGLHRLADELGATAIVVGVSHARGMERIEVGSVTEQTLHGSPCAVAVAPVGYAESDATLRAISVAYNGSNESRQALRVAAEIARAANASLQIIGVVEQGALWYGGYMGPHAALDVGDFVREQLDEARQRLTGIEDVTVRVLGGSPARSIAGASTTVDLLVLGSRGHGPLRRVLLGSVSSRLVRKPPCPLLVLPRTAITSASGDEAEGSTVAPLGASPADR